jgi:hypothetical protein
MTRLLRSWRFWLAPVFAAALALTGPGCGPPATTGASKDGGQGKDAGEKKDKGKDGGKDEKKPPEREPG